MPVNAGRGAVTRITRSATRLSRPCGKVAVVIPTLNEAESIAAAIAALPRHLVDQVIVADGGSTDVGCRISLKVRVVGASRLHRQFLDRLDDQVPADG
jgi:hypothetical protein